MQLYSRKASVKVKVKVKVKVDQYRPQGHSAPVAENWASSLKSCFSSTAPQYYSDSSSIGVVLWPLQPKFIRLRHDSSSVPTEAHAHSIFVRLDRDGLAHETTMVHVHNIGYRRRPPLGPVGGALHIIRRGKSSSLYSWSRYNIAWLGLSPLHMENGARAEAGRECECSIIT